jgi:hypothetical protein
MHRQSEELVLRRPVEAINNEADDATGVNMMNRHGDVHEQGRFSSHAVRDERTSGSKPKHVPSWRKATMMPSDLSDFRSEDKISPAMEHLSGLVYLHSHPPRLPNAADLEAIESSEVRSGF